MSLNKNVWIQRDIINKIITLKNEVSLNQNN